MPERTRQWSNLKSWRKLRDYSWPGNVRQLRNCLERAVLLANDGRITVSELPPEVAGRTMGATSFVLSPSRGRSQRG